MKRTMTQHHGPHQRQGPQQRRWPSWPSGANGIGQSKSPFTLGWPMLSFLLAAMALLMGSCASPEAEGTRTAAMRPSERAAAGMNGNSAGSLEDGFAERHRPMRNPDAEDGFGAQWYSGTAEVNAYDLEQARYGQIRQGDAVLVFVTEDFHAQDQVKLDRPTSDPADQIKVLKMNGMRSFETGVYAYQTMRSVFTPVQLATHPATLKSTASVQEWCGMVYQQLNRGNQGFDAQWRSYFQSEGDGSTRVPDVLLEDEIFNRIRLAPESLPTGRFEALPSSLDIRLYHLPVQALAAEGRMEDLPSGERQYSLRYPDSGTELRVRFGAEFPRPILGWEKERVVAGRTLTTKATRRSVQQWPYWNYSSLSDSSYRRMLGF